MAGKTGKARHDNDKYQTRLTSSDTYLSTTEQIAKHCIKLSTFFLSVFLSSFPLDLSGLLNLIQNQIQYMPDIFFQHVQYSGEVQ